MHYGNKTINYWKYLKAKLKKENSEVVSKTTQLTILAPDGKYRLSDLLDYNGIIALGKEFPGKSANRFIPFVCKRFNIGKHNLVFCIKTNFGLK